MHDVIIVGGSFAGLAAALQLGRARRSVLVLDAGQRRNRFAARSHGFLGQDGVAPGDIIAKGRAEVLAYPTVTLREAHVLAARAVGDGFVVRTAAGDEHPARRLILATGVSDELPALPGLAERWGRSAFHCPYCHGYELDQGHLGVLATSPLSAHHAIHVSDWTTLGNTTLFLNGVFEPDEEQRAALASREIRVEPVAVESLGGDEPGVDVWLTDGRVERVAGLFLASRAVLTTPFAAQLGCALEAGPLGDFYQTDAMKETTVPGVFACGDAARMAGSVSFAVADGVLAGTAAHRSLIFRALPAAR